MKRWWIYSVAVVLVGLSVAGQFYLKSQRPESAPALAESAIAALGGLRSVIAEVVWFRADRLQEEGRYAELSQLAATLAFLEPHTPEVWSYSAWNLAYNISIMMPTPEDRWRWVEAAIRLLRDRGLKLNPREAELYRELAFLFEIKLGTDTDAAAETYRAKWKAIVEDVAARNAWDEIGMDLPTMEKFEQVTGMTDRTHPQYSAAYWASKGLPYAGKEDERFLAMIIKQAHRIYTNSKTTQGPVL